VFFGGGILKKRDRKKTAPRQRRTGRHFTPTGKVQWVARAGKEITGRIKQTRMMNRETEREKK